MRVIVQRVSEATVRVEGEVVGAIGRGLLVLAGFETADSEEDLVWTAQKLISLRIFSDKSGVMNLSLGDVSGRMLVVSQFTLHAATRKGARPSFIRAARPEIAAPLYESFCALLEREINTEIARGRFGADMQVSLTNDGPMTIFIDSKTRE